MQIMLEICDRVADKFDIKFNSNKSVAMRVGRRYDARCDALQHIQMAKWQMANGWFRY